MQWNVMLWDHRKCRIGLCDEPVRLQNTQKSEDRGRVVVWKAEHEVDVKCASTAKHWAKFSKSHCISRRHCLLLNSLYLCYVNFLIVFFQVSWIKHCISFTISPKTIIKHRYKQYFVFTQCRGNYLILCWRDVKRQSINRGVLLRTNEWVAKMVGWDMAF